MTQPTIQYLDDSTKGDSKSAKREEKRRRGGLFILLMLVLSFVMGGVGAFGTLSLLSDNQALMNKLGLKNLAVNTTETKKINVEESSAVIDASAKVSPSVVSITTTTNVMDFYGRISQESGAGTGIILTNDGYIATNKHVASDTNTKYTVILSDGRNFDGRVIATDPVNDFAIMKIEATGLRAAELGDSDKLQVGQSVIAIGNALGQFQNTVTVGVVSAKERQIQASSSSASSAQESLENLLQTDAAINPGNSGGPLVNIDGQVIGINTALASNAQGIGFAIPINAVKTAITSAEQTGKITRPSLGVRYISITKDIANLNHLSLNHGALVIRGQTYGEVAVLPGGAADKAGIQENDIITEVNGDAIDEQHSLSSLIRKYNVGDSVKITFTHQGTQKTVDVTLTAAN